MTTATAPAADGWSADNPFARSQKAPASRRGFLRPTDWRGTTGETSTPVLNPDTPRGLPAIEPYTL
jgi:hypothetical protein